MPGGTRKRIETDVVGARLRRLAWLATIAAITVAVALPASAAADAQALVDFEDAPIGTQITTRYLHTGG